MDNKKIINEKQDLIGLGKLLSEFVVGMEGNVSKRTKSGFVIKSSGSNLKNLTESSLISYDQKWNQVDCLTSFPSMEIGFHKFLLNFDSVNVVAHTHPTNTMKILCSKKSKKFSKFRIFPDQVVFNGIKSCLVPYATPGDDLTKIIIKRVTKFIKNEGYFPKLILLKNHGIITCGVNENECVIITEICEKSAEIFLGSQILGETIFLKFKKIRELSKDIREKYRKSKL